MEVVEMNRLLTGLIQVIQEVDTNNGQALCNNDTCPTMSAGRYVHARRCFVPNIGEPKAHHGIRS